MGNKTASQPVPSQPVSSQTDAYESFPTPTRQPVSALSPVIWPGISAESSEALQSILRDNHKRWNIFFNDAGFHNHAAHHVLAKWLLGAPKEILDEAYKIDSEHLKPMFDSPEAITEKNFNDHLGDKRFYKAYLTFFTKVVQELGPDAALEKYIFSPEANWDSTDKTGNKHPEMLNRFMSGLVHPMIHAGYGFEFKLPGMVMEGLAETAVHQAQSTPLHPTALWTQTSEDKLVSQMDSVTLDGTSQAHTAEQGTHFFTVLESIFEDDAFKFAETPQEGGIYDGMMKSMGDKLYTYCDQWTANAQNINDKIAELQWMNSMFYALAGVQKGKNFNADFYLMHLVTSSIFLPSLCANLQPSSQVRLLRSYFNTSVSWWVARGRPKLDIEQFYTSTTPHPLPPKEELANYPPPQKWHLPSSSSDLATVPSSWGPIVQKTLVHPEAHVAKIQRAFAHYDQLYGGIKKGHFKDGKEKFRLLPGKELLDGTLFVRAAGLTADRLGRVSEEAPEWDRDGFYQ